MGGDTFSDTGQRLREAIVGQIPDAQVEVEVGSPGHFSLRVVSRVFTVKSPVQQQQAVYAAIAPLMRGNDAPVHAIDRLRTMVPPGA